MSKPLTIVLAAGGTGGHMFPAIAVGDALTARGHTVIAATDGRGQRFGAGIETENVTAGGIGGGAIGKIKGLCKIGLGAGQAMLMLRRRKADVVVGFGGYPSLPTMLAALLLRKRTVIHDQNAVLGRANRLLAGRVNRIATSFRDVKGVPEGIAVLTGNPVRSDIVAISTETYTAPDQSDAINLLVFGGSQGARIFSDVIPASIAALPDGLRQRAGIVQQARPEDMDRVQAAYDEADQQAEIASFFDDMPDRMRNAHLVIARSGASTVAELAAAGRPAILIPYAAALDDHQTANAAALVAAGGAWLLPEENMTAETMAALITEVLSAPKGLESAAGSARSAARADAAEALADVIEAAALQSSRNAASQTLGGIAA
ncbi:MAG: undecaprenyldiphospho-muramoylpentapeptide beta-N-acetylglucosaminyltransferase [Alphaproteobacteria bacterium]|nr:undecaprenyldiphospho-muramoylpentapeptide beta-N-acetylglucosaminyltransferase [Alphaproteobacteria bacterium]